MFSNISTEQTERRGTRLLAAVVASTAFALLGSVVHGAPQEVNRTRSIYVPVRFQACEHMTNATLAVTGDPHEFALGTRIFMFTYYPEREAVLAEFTEVWIEGDATTDEGVRTIRTNLLVTPERSLLPGFSEPRPGRDRKAVASPERRAPSGGCHPDPNAKMAAHGRRRPPARAAESDALAGAPVRR